MRLAVLGCGAATERLHLPAARRVAGLEVTTLVDHNLDRARALAKRFGVPRVAANADAIDADAVLIALPNRLHAPVSIDMLQRGISVLVEKPMAMSAAEARAMIEAASHSRATLQIGMSKRFARGTSVVQTAIDSGMLGPIRSFTIDWGVKFDWPLASDAGMAPAEAGGGVLMDFGSHFLDLMCAWLGAPELQSYVDDAQGGLEADCELVVTMRGPMGDVPVTARFSRLRTLPNLVRVAGDEYALEWAHEVPDAVSLRPLTERGAPPAFTWTAEPRQSTTDVHADQLRAFVAAASGDTTAAVAGASVLPGMELIERCYAARVYAPPMWDHPVHVPAGDR